MNIDEFIDRLAKMRDRKNWYLNHGCIRGGERGLECPITSFKGQDALHVFTVGWELGLGSN